MQPLNHRKTRVAVCGEKRIAEACLNVMRACPDTDICAVVASPQDWQADLVQWGVTHRTKVYVGNINRYTTELKALELDFIFSIQSRRLLRSEVLAIPRRGCINLHFGLLPRYGGCYPVAWAILNGESHAGATLHYMTERFDEGDVIAQQSVPLRPHTTARDLFDHLSEAGARLFEAQYPILRREREYRALPQDSSQRLYYDKKSIDFERDRWIDWRRSGVDVQRHIYAFTFEPFQLPVTWLQGPDGQQTMVSVSQVRLCEGQAPPSYPGSILSCTPSGAILAVTGDGMLLEIGVLNDQMAHDFMISLGYDLQRTRLISGKGEGT